MEILVPLYIDEGVSVDTPANQPLFNANLGGRSCFLYLDEAHTDERESRLSVLHKDDCLLVQGDLYIYMDAMPFGNGMACVQTTFSCKTISDARYLYDQSIVLAPFLLAVSAF